MSPEQLEKQRQLLGLPSYIEQLKRQQQGQTPVTPLEVLGALTRPLESVTAAPARAAVAKLQQSAPLSEVVQAFKAQMGKPPETAPSGEQLAQATGLGGKPAKVAGLGLEMAIDPTNLIGAGVAKAAVPLLGLAGALAKTEKLAKKAQDITKAAKAADLPMDAASRLKRAEEMGFNIDAFHGTNKDISEFIPSGGGEYGKGIYFTNNPKEAALYARGKEEKGKSFIANKGGNIVPVKLKLENPYVVTPGESIWGKKFDFPENFEQLSERVKAAGFDGIIDPTKSLGEGTQRYMKELGLEPWKESIHYVVFDSKNIRSKFAAFDPSKAKSGVITAGGAIAVPALVERMRQQEQEKAVGR